MGASRQCLPLEHAPSGAHAFDQRPIEMDFAVLPACAPADDGRQDLVDFLLEWAWWKA
jgi:hypothetical protein